MGAQEKVKKLTEGKAVFYASTGRISKKLKVFYNPVMKLNRDISILLLNSIRMSNMQIADILAGSGVRAVRFAKELKKKKIRSIHVNDSSNASFNVIERNVLLNNAKNIKIHNEDANEFLLKSSGFDYIDVDPFGSPNPFLNSAIVRLSRNGILAVTATDTSALAGSHELACRRKYWAKPLRNGSMHEIGARILIRKVQLIGAQFEKALIPVFVHASAHYIRIYFICKKSKSVVDELLGQHLYLLHCNKCLEFRISHYNLQDCCAKEMLWCGPLWTGQLWDSKLADAMLKSADKNDKELVKLLTVIAGESRIRTVGFVDMPQLAGANKFMLPKQNVLLDRIRKKGFRVSLTHFNPAAVRTDMPVKKLALLF